MGPETRSRLLRAVVERNGCWIWPNAPDSDGYPIVKVGGRSRRAHRLFYEMLVGPIPDGLQLDHLCRVRNCVNPEHLEPVTCRENVQRGLKGRLLTHCRNGHEFSSDNTYVTPDGSRTCRECQRASVRKYRARRASLAAPCGA